jgi:hypothetical protein
MFLPDEIELKTFRVTRHGFDQKEVANFLRTLAAEVRGTFDRPESGPDARIVARREARWWVCTGSLAQGGKKVLGPFGTRSLALQVRDLLEQVRTPVIFWVDEEPVLRPPGV